mmetsp:Transcript_10087/g.33307  ORF Transcript_10087/g.33307 Transcript_10087/m.33307 type:complete len:229 (-) Transcript_10087:483-1169(-)|eukprot:scaffold6285_cov121-Isochrysis_galbana.AAC.23
MASWLVSFGPSGANRSQRRVSSCPFHAALETAPCRAALTCPRSRPCAMSHRHVSTLPAAAAHCTAAQPKRFIARTSTRGWLTKSSIVGRCPPKTAQSKADESSRMRRDTSAPAVYSRYCATLSWPYFAANMRAVRPTLLEASTGTRASSTSHWTASSCPYELAHMSAVLPNLSTACSGGQPASASARAVATSPEAHALIPPRSARPALGVRPSRSRIVNVDFGGAAAP